MSTPVTIIVPVYNGHDVLAACLDRLAATLGDLTVDVDLVDDASPDPRIRPLLQAAAQRAGWRTTLQDRNRGFVGTVNAAMARAAGDVILLNSDTLPTRGCWPRILACAAADARIASITPFSNNAEICSFPEFCRNNPVPDDLDTVAVACADGAPAYPELPTAVGFCMFLRRAALAAIGDFDAATFGHGYGEENDWCLRAAAHGWRNVLCDDAFVAHVGGQSFADTAHRPGGENLRRLVARYPDYNDRVADFIRRDPLAARRAVIRDRLRH